MERRLSTERLGSWCFPRFGVVQQTQTEAAVVLRHTCRKAVAVVSRANIVMSLAVFGGQQHSGPLK